MKILIFVFIILNAFSCGTIIKNHDYVISIDSYKRGSDVFNTKGELLGKTPFFYSIEKNREQVFTLKNDSETMNQTYVCNFDLSESIMPNTVFTALTFPFGGISGAVDWYNGNMYKCNLPLFFKNEAGILQSTAKRKILIIPASTKSFSASGQIEKKYIEYMEKNFKKISVVSAKEDLSEIGITSYTDNEIKRINLNLLNKVLQKHEITHIVIFSIKDLDNKIEAVAHYYDAFNLKKLETDEQKYIVETDKFNYWETFLNKVHFIPNSLRISKQDFQNNEEYLLKNSKHPKSFPQAVTAFSVGTVYNPSRYESWDIDFYSSPNFSIPSWASTVNNKTYLFQSLLGTFNGGMLLKTPFGALSGEIGWGAIYLYEKPEEINKSVRAIFAVNLSYVLYFTKTLFFNVQMQTFALNNTSIANEVVRLQQVSIGIGYYLPFLETLFYEETLK